MKNILIIILLFSSPVLSQIELEKTLRGYTNPGEIVTLSEALPFNQAIEILSEISEKTAGKRIISMEEIKSPIGVEIDKMQYKKALVIIVQYNGLVFEEKAEVIIVKSRTDPTANIKAENYAAVSEREVRISALFFEANSNEMNEQGLDWRFVFSQAGVNIGAELSTTAKTTQEEKVTPAGANISATGNYQSGIWNIDATTLFKFFETESLGEIISKPQVTVKNGSEGRIQVGSDISIKQRDFSGNIVEKFFSTGSIITVTPHIYTEQGVDYVLLQLEVERSSLVPNEQTTEIRKTIAKTDVLMINGEETVIGGLYLNEEIIARVGIPILKDLPWWFFGIRYLTGYDKVDIAKKEVVILIKANILPSLKDRLATERSETLLQRQRETEEETIRRIREALKR